MDILNTQKAALRAVFLLSDGTTETTTLGSVPVWASEDTGIMALTPSADGFTCTATCVSGSEGSVNVTVSANADLTGGSREINASVNFQVQNVVVVVPEAGTVSIAVDSISDI